MGNEKTSKKGRLWAFVCYPENAPVDWLEQLQQTGLEVAVSPLHDKDLDPDGKPKKAHYHVILKYNGPTSFTQVRQITDNFNQPIPIKLESMKGYYRYFLHLDNPDKHQYMQNEIIHLNGFDADDLLQLSKGANRKLMKDTIKLCIEKGINEYYILVEYAMFNLDADYFDLITKNTMFFNGYLRSKKSSEVKTQVINEELYVIDEQGELLNVQNDTLKENK